MQAQSIKNDLKQVIDFLFPSRVRVKIMSLFFRNSSQEFHMRHISRIISEQINAVRRELIIMEKIGFLTSRMDGIRKLYMVNPYFTLYSDLRSLTMKSGPLGQQLLEKSPEIGGIKFAVLSHTYISGEKSDHYNVDLVIVGSPNMDMLVRTVTDSQKEEGKEIFYIVLSEFEFENRKKRRDPLIYSLMVLPRAMLIGRDEEFVV